MTTPRILIVEDEAIIARDLTRQLSLLGFETVGDTPRGEDAIPLAEKLRPDLVLMDIHLAGHIDGITTATSIRQRQDIPVVFLTAFADDAVLERAKSAEPFGYIVKPFDERELRSTIEIALAKHAGEVRLRRSREELAAILQTAMDGYWLVERNGMIADVNDAACSMLGFSRDELAGRFVSEIEVVETEAAVAAHIADVCRQGSARFESRHRCKDGHEINVEVSVTHLPENSGRFVAFLRDISARKHANAENEAMTALLRTANNPCSLREFLQTSLTLLRNWSGCESVGVRLREEDTSPYYEVGSSGVLVEKDKYLCDHSANGELLRGADGKRLVHCLCHDLLCGETATCAPALTPRGSYWNNTVVDMMANPFPVPGNHNHRRTRIPESVAIIPLRLGATTLGLLVFNHSRPQAFSAEQVGAMEHLADNLAIAIAQRQSQAALLASEQRFRLLLESTSDYTVSVRQRPDGATQTRHGSGCVKVTGYSPADFVRQSRLWLDMVPPEDRGRVEAFARRLSAGEQPEPIEHRIVHRDGSIRWVHNSVVVRRTAEGEILQDGVITDITERKDAEERVRASEAKFATVFRSAPLMIAISRIDDGTYIEVNDALLRATGYTAQEVLGHTSVALGIMPAEERPRMIARLQAEGRVSAAPLTITGKDGRKLDCLFSAEKIEIAGAPHLLSIALDLTAHKRIESQLRQVQKMEAFGQLAGGVAHDFNNILVALTLHVGLLRQSELLDAETAASLHELEQEAARGASLTRQLMAFSRQRPLEMNSVDLNETVANLLKMLRRVLGERIAVEWVPAPALPAVEGDVGTLEQVLMNLCVNARDAMDGAGHLVIATAAVEITAATLAEHPAPHPGTYVRLSVTDSGHGMDAETRARIFEPFYTTKEVGRGTGLGLSIVHGIVQQHGGWIEVDSKVGHGSTFAVFVPTHAEPPAPRPSSVSAKPLGQGETVLVVEDEESVRAIYTTTLARYGYRVLAARTGPDALDLWRDHRDEIALLLTDMILPGGMSGADLVRELRTQSPGLPVVVASGYTGERDVSLPADAIKLAKPFEAEALLVALRTALENHAAP